MTTEDVFSPGMYQCSGPKCRWAYVFIAPNHWHGPIFDGGSHENPYKSAHLGRRMTWEQMRTIYADCVPLLKRG